MCAGAADTVMQTNKKVPDVTESEARSALETMVFEVCVAPCGICKKSRCG